MPRLVRTNSAPAAAAVLNSERTPVEPHSRDGRVRSRIAFLTSRLPAWLLHRGPSQRTHNRIRNTKYTVLSFVPLNLIEQFGRFMNLYFLFIACLQLWNAVTPVDPASTWIPLLFIFTVSATKEGVDDWRRYKADRRANLRLVRVLRPLGTNGNDTINSRHSSSSGDITQDSSLRMHESAVSNSADVRASTTRVPDHIVEIVPAETIVVGDIVVVHKDEEVPCDLCLLASSDHLLGSAYIETANIDGETDYKLRTAIAATKDAEPAELGDLSALIECNNPNSSVYEFDARFLLLRNDDERLESELGSVAVVLAADARRWQTLSSDQLVLGGTYVRTTDWLAGVAVYTGNETKMGCSKSKAPAKKTRADRMIDRVTMLVFCAQLLLVFAFGIAGDMWQNIHAAAMWYVDYEGGSGVLGGLPDSGPSVVVIPIRFLLLNSMMIPISLKVSLDVAKFCYAKFIDWDAEMAYTTNQPLNGDHQSQSRTHVEHAHAVSTAISEDLGQIEYVFTDKTGTLTENVMMFVACSVGGVEYWRPDSTTNSTIKTTRDLRHRMSEDSGALAFALALALCHSVTADGDSNPEYTASSPDELALVNAARTLFGLVFVHRDVREVIAKWDDSRAPFSGTVRREVVAVLEFSSDRKRMSVVLRDLDTNQFTLVMKGADEVVLSHVSSDKNEQARLHLEEFATKGLRTLCIAEKHLPAHAVDEWLPKYHNARSLLHGRDTAVTDAFELLEHDLTLLGITAIEDKLQDGVPEAIRRLREAGMRVWMLTGDKFRTAVQIGRSCNLLAAEGDISGNASLLVVQSADLESLRPLAESGRALAARNAPYSVIIEGTVLSRIQQDSCAQSAFYELAISAHTVVCCRVTPQQKADVVQMVAEKGFMTLAIGDGGNDVSMIQTAAVGVGISGHEGLQAARAADYSIGQFRFLVRLCLVHGRYSFHRTAFVAQYCFYKSMLICAIQIFYQFLTGVSGTTFFSTFALTTYNILFTSLPVFAFVLDRDLPIEALEQTPSLYASTRTSRQLRLYTVAGWFAAAVFQAAVVFSVTIGSVWSLSIDSNGEPMDYSSLSTIAYSSLLIVNAATQFQASNSLTGVNHSVIWATPIFYVTALAFASETLSSKQFGTVDRLFGDMQFWLSIIVSSSLAIVPLFGLHMARKFASPSVEDTIRMRSQGRTERSAGFGHLKLSDTENIAVNVDYDSHEDGTALSASRTDSENSPLLRLRPGAL